MNQFFEKPLHCLGIIVIYLALVSLIRLGSWGVIESSEARYAEISREMAEQRDWVHPTLLGIKHYHKPPVTYWITMVGYKLFGVNAFGARFFLVISYLVQILLIYFIACKLFVSNYNGLVAAVLYSGLPIVLISVRGLTTDNYLMTCILAAIWLWLMWKSTSRPVWLYFTAVALGVGFLTKGPVVLIIPILVMLGVKPFHFKTQTMFGLHYILATLLFLVLASSWFIVLAIEDKNIVNYFLFRHTLDRYANANVFKGVEPWWYYLAYLPPLALPWLLTFIFKIRVVTEKSESLLVKQILIFWVAIPFIFFSISSSKLILYVLPLSGGVILASTFWISNFTLKQYHTLEKTVLGFAIMIGIGLGIFINFDKTLHAPLALKLTPFFYLIGLIGLRQAVRVAVQYKPLLYSLYLTGFLMLYSGSIMHYNDLKFNSTYSVARWLKMNGLDNYPVLVYNRLLPSLSFHLQKPVISLNDGHLAREVEFEKTENWKRELYNLVDSTERKRLHAVLLNPTVLVVKNELKESSAWLNKYYNRQHVVGQWRIFYTDSHP